MIKDFGDKDKSLYSIGPTRTQNGSMMFIEEALYQASHRQQYMFLIDLSV